MPSLLPHSDRKRLVLYDVSWKSYIRFLKRIEGRRRFRTSYDRGILEIMTLTFEHEGGKSLLRRLIEALTLVLGIPIRSAGSTTFKRRIEEKGLEPDECYYLRNQAKIRGKKRLSLLRDPPPDLAIEIVVTHFEVDRMLIYAAFRVPEVWCYEHEVVKVYILEPTGTYRESQCSLNFPFLPLADLNAFLRAGEHEEETALVRRFMVWVEENKEAWTREMNSPPSNGR